MDNKYRVFTQPFNSVLDLVETYENRFYEKYKSWVDVVNETVLEAIGETDSLSTGNKEYNVDYLSEKDFASVDYILKKQPYVSSMMIRKINEDDLFVSGLYLKLFHLSIRNTEEKQENLKVYYEENNGKYSFIGTNDVYNEIFDCAWEVYLGIDGEDYYLDCRVMYRGVDIYNEKIDITFDEIYRYVDENSIKEDDNNLEF